MTNSYKIGFARTSLLQETVLIAKVFCELQEWGAVKHSVRDGNLLQARTDRSIDVVYGEIHKRLSLMNELQIEVIACDYPQDVRQLAWIAMCKQYPFIGDFTIEVLSSAHLSGRSEISYEDYGYFFNSKVLIHPELETVSNKTRSNAQPALFQMMRQCELIGDFDQLIPQMISPAVLNCSPESDLAFIPGAMRL